LKTYIEHNYLLIARRPNRPHRTFTGFSGYYIAIGHRSSKVGAILAPGSGSLSMAPLQACSRPVGLDEPRPGKGVALLVAAFIFL